MIYRTEIRDIVRIEQSISDDELVDVVNGCLVDDHYITNKEDPESIPELDLDFIIAALNEKIDDDDSFTVYINIDNIWYQYWIENVVQGIVEEYLYDMPGEIVDFGDLVSVEYEREVF